MKYPCDGEPRLLVRALLCSARQAATRRARAALFDSSRRGASRSFAAECEPLARAPTNCHASVHRRRALPRRPDAHTVATLLGTCSSAQKFEIPLWRRVRNRRSDGSFICLVVATRVRSSNPRNIKTKSEACDSQPRANHDHTLIV